MVDPKKVKEDVETTVTAELLERHGKLWAARYLRAQPPSCRLQLLRQLLGRVLSPLKPITDETTVDWLRWLMSGEHTPEAFAEQVRQYDNAQRCGMVWTADFVAYRCRTCGVSPCMSLCAECFQRGNHEGHDYNMFRSQAGGACDCGDPYVMKETGFCSLHGQLDPSQQRRPPDSLMEIPRLMLPFIFRRLLIYLRMNSRLMDETSSDSLSSLMSRLDVFLSYLQELCSMRAAMRSSMTNVLISKQLYLEMDSESVSLDDPHLSSDTTKLVQEAYRNYLEAVNNMPNPDLPAHLRVLSPALGNQIRHCSMLDELVFWTYKYEFPTKLVCFLLNMLPEQKYKECFASAFVVHYARISQMLAASNDPDPLTNRVVHVSVQLFSNELLAVRMTEDMHLLHAMIVSLTYMTGRILVNCQLHDSNRNTHMVANCADKIMKNHCYWPLVSDLSNVLGHKPVSLYFLSDDQLLHMWFSYLSMYQGMNVNFRQLDTHVDMEPSTYYAAFSAELEGSATPMWALLAHLREPGAATLSKRLLRHAYAALQKWHDNIGCPQTYEEILADTSTDLRCSFHLPLHRYVALIISEATKRQGLSLHELLPSETMMVTLVSHLLRLQVSFYEICAGLWVRNGNQMRGQTMTYTQCHFCCSMVDPDIYLLQLGATILDPDKFLTLILKKFHVWEWLSFAPNATNSFLEADQEIPMVEACLTFLATLLCVRTCGGISEEEIARLEIATQLCMGDKTHSQLTELLPEKSETVNSPSLFETALAQVSRYRGPASEASGNMQQGIYGPKPEVWHTLYNPIYVMLRAMVRKEFQTSMDRFTAFVKNTGQYTDSRTSPWPPYRLPPHPPTPPASSPASAAPADSWRVPNVQRLLSCSTFYGVLMAVLRRCVNETTVSEQLMALTVFLLEMAVREPERPPTGQEMYCSSVAEREECTDLCFSEWFATPRSSDNLRRVIDNVTVPHTANPSLWPSNTANDSGEVLIESMSVADDMESHQDPLYSGMPPPAPLPAMAITAATSAATVNSSSGGGGSTRSSVSDSMDVAPLTDPGTPSVATPHDPEEPLLALNSMAVLPALMAGTEVARVAPSMAPLVPLEGDMRVQHQTRALAEDEDAMRRRGTLTDPMLSLVSYDADMTVANPSMTSGSSGFTDDVEVAVLDWYNDEAAAGGVDDENEMVSAMTATSTGSGGGVSRTRHLASTSVAFGESIVSLLLKLHSKLSDQSDSYRLPSDEELENMTESRVGNGPFFVGQLLSFIAKKDPLLKQHIAETQNRLWPKAEEEDSTKLEDREARRRMARERQQRLMRQFAHKQRQFQQQMETESGVSAGSTSSAPSSTPSPHSEQQPEYDCVICGQNSGSGAERRPFGLVVLLQASSVLAHQRLTRQQLQLPVDEPSCRLLRQQLAANRAGFVEMVHERLANTFDDKSWLLTMNIGVSGGVHVQTCGHHLHLDCHRLYISSLSGHEARQQGVSLQRGEFSCPLCRQQCNCVLPLLDSASQSAPPAQVSSPSHDCHQMQQDGLQQQQKEEVVAVAPDMYRSIHEMLTDAAPTEYDQNFWEPISKAMESMTHVTYPRYRNTTPQSPGHENVLLFVASIARTNLEMEVVQRGGRLVGTGDAAAQLVPGVKRSSLRPLLTVLGFNAKMLSVRLSNRYLPAAWVRLNGLDTGSYDALTLYQPEVPMLARDPSALLILLILTLPWPPSPPVFACIVRALYNLAVVQACTALSLQLAHRQRVQCLLAYVMLSDREHSQNNITWLLGTILDCLHNVPGLYTDDTASADIPLSGASSSAPDPGASSTTEAPDGASGSSTAEPSSVDPASLEPELIERCLPFVRVAAVLQQHLWQRPLPSLPATADSAAEISALCRYLGLTSSFSDTCCDRLYWPPSAVVMTTGAETAATATVLPSGGGGVALARVWCEQFRSVALQWQYTARDLLRQPRWCQPRLLQLPHQYKHIFLFYHRRECARCGTVPKEPTVCLVCGTLVCLRGQCCKQQHANETVVHSVQCGAGTSVFLAIDSCMVIVIRGRRACLWGSVYLDSFGEEDRELKRGRPLFLCQERYDLLQNLWVAHAFDNTRRRWIWHKEML